MMLENGVKPVQPAPLGRIHASQKGRAPLQNVHVVAGYPMQIVAVDIVGPISPSTTGNTYILVASDYFTRWVEAYTILNQEAAVTVATKLVDEYFCRFSVYPNNCILIKVVNSSLVSCRRYVVCSIYI